MKEVSASHVGYFELAVDRFGDLSLFVDFWVIVGFAALSIVGMALRFFSWRPLRRGYERSEAKFGVGDHSVTIRPNTVDRQIAYKIWVELSTRKIGLPIDLEDDVIAEVYDSWYQFFKITRELLKEIPATRLQDRRTGEIVSLSIKILNTGLRPHLTKWQARFRRWYVNQEKNEPDTSLPPQDIQKKYPNYNELTENMMKVNDNLMAYRELMYNLASGR